MGTGTGTGTEGELDNSEGEAEFPLENLLFNLLPDLKDMWLVAVVMFKATLCHFSVLKL